MATRAGSSAVTLDRTDNQIGGAVSITGSGAVALRDSNALQHPLRELTQLETPLGADADLIEPRRRARAAFAGAVSEERTNVFEQLFRGEVVVEVGQSLFFGLGLNTVSRVCVGTTNSILRHFNLPFSPPAFPET